jgi:hypothetical protein
MKDKAYPYQFTVLEVPEFNALCLPGGFMYVFEGLLTRLADDDAVAFVMAHEITHASERHWKRMVEKMRGPALLAALAGTAFGADDVAMFAATLVEAQYSREQEASADEGGVSLAASAGFDPVGAVAAAQLMAKLDSGDSTPLYLRSHPPARDRVRHLEGRAKALADAPRRAAAASPVPQHPVREGPSGVHGTSSPWLPLAVGNEWTYSVLADGRRSSLRIAIGGELDLPLGRAWRADVAIPGLKPVTAYLFPAGNTVWRLDRPFDPGCTWRRDWAFVTEPGASAGSVRHEVVGRETVGTPCGVFADCLHVRRTEADRVTDAWFAEGVGLVRRRTSPGDVTETLTAYSVARPSGGR